MLHVVVVVFVVVVVVFVVVFVVVQMVTVKKTIHSCGDGRVYGRKIHNIMIQYNMIICHTIFMQHTQNSWSYSMLYKLDSTHNVMTSFLVFDNLFS